MDAIAGFLVVTGKRRIERAKFHPAPGEESHEMRRVFLGEEL
jgi:hypothetical protein